MHKSSVSVMETIVSRLDITRIFCDLDDFCQEFERQWLQAHLPQMSGENLIRCRMCLSEIMTIVIAFHGSGYRNFKDFYTRASPTLLEQSLSKASQLHSVCRGDAVEFNGTVFVR